MLHRFAAAWRFLTVFPFFSPPGADEGTHLARSIPAFPAVGFVLGVFAAIVAAVAGAILPPMPAAAITVACLVLFSMGLHLDGLADSADALMSPGRPREAALAIMKDSRIGAHGAMAVVLVLLTKFACLASLAPGAMAAAALCVPVAGRTAMLFPMVLLPYARENGLGKIFRVGDAKALLSGAAVFAGMVFLFAAPPRGLVLITLFVAATTLWWTRFLRRRLGGATGDSYGAACELAETAACLGAAAGMAPEVTLLIS